MSFKEAKNSNFTKILFPKLTFIACYLNCECYNGCSFGEWIPRSIHQEVSQFLSHVRFAWGWRAADDQPLLLQQQGCVALNYRFGGQRFERLKWFGFFVDKINLSVFNKLIRLDRGLPKIRSKSYSNRVLINIFDPNLPVPSIVTTISIRNFTENWSNLSLELLFSIKFNQFLVNRWIFDINRPFLIN